MAIGYIRKCSNVLMVCSWPKAAPGPLQLPGQKRSAPPGALLIQLKEPTYAPPNLPNEAAAIAWSG